MKAHQPELLHGADQLLANILRRHLTASSRCGAFCIAFDYIARP
jgi:hypothetical protein